MDVIIFFVSGSSVSEVAVFTVWDNSNTFSADIFSYFDPNIRTFNKRNRNNFKLKQHLSMNHKNSKKKF